MANYENENYMFFKNLKQIARQATLILEMDPNMLDELLKDGHDWANDHMSVSKENMDQVFDFIMNKTNGSSNQTQFPQFESNVAKFDEYVLFEKKKKGLWANVHAKRKRGEKPAKKGDDDYPDKEAWEAAQTKRKSK
jgi:hypothetical protein